MVLLLPWTKGGESETVELVVDQNQLNSANSARSAYLCRKRRIVSARRLWDSDCSTKASWFTCSYGGPAPFTRQLLTVSIDNTWRDCRAGTKQLWLSWSAWSLDPLVCVTVLTLSCSVHCRLFMAFRFSSAGVRQTLSQLRLAPNMPCMTLVYSPCEWARSLRVVFGDDGNLKSNPGDHNFGSGGGDVCRRHDRTDSTINVELAMHWFSLACQPLLPFCVRLTMKKSASLGAAKVELMRHVKGCSTER
jgi:hypothetical protein